MDEKSELTDLPKVDWANLTGQELAKLMAEATESMTGEDWAEEEAQSRFLAG